MQKEQIIFAKIRKCLEWGHYIDDVLFFWRHYRQLINESSMKYVCRLNTYSPQLI